MTENRLDALVGANIQRLRQSVGMSQAELATHVGDGFRQQTILKIEKGTRPLKLAEAKLIAEALAVEVADFFRDSPEVEQIGQIERLIAMVMKQYQATHDSVALLEYLRAKLAGMSSAVEFPLPPKVQQYADEWSSDDLLESCTSWARSNLATNPVLGLQLGLRERV